jgi:magnesium chelatase family protein
VEACSGRGLPGLTLVGLARGAVRESLVRVRSALQAVEASLCTTKLVVNMLPAELPKDASALDLPLAVALLVMAQKLPPDSLAGRRFFGELSLGGAVQGVRGAVLLADLSRRQGDRELILPKSQAPQAAIIPGVRAIGVATLQELLAHLRGEQVLSPCAPAAEAAVPDGPCLSDVHGQKRAKQALEVAAAGNHNLLLVGPPGSGKTMLACRLQGLLPQPSVEERIAITRIGACASDGSDATLQLACCRPFRAPHHSISDVALVGGGAKITPGEITLAHLGVLFLDELPEFSRRALEALREPLEAGSIRISRSMMSLLLPSEVLLVAAMNPCPCGQLRPPGSAPTGGRPCLCAMEQVQRYRARISGPLMDRIDLRVQVAPVSFGALLGARGPSAQNLTSAQVRERVALARQRQSARLGPGRTNASMTSAELQAFAPLQGRVAQVLRQAMDRYALSARSVTRVLKVARTVADLSDQEAVRPEDVILALKLRLWERPVGPYAGQKKAAPQGGAAP